MIQIGIDLFVQNQIYKNKEIGILTNQSSVNCESIHNVDLLLKNGYRIKKIFVPEHGLWGHYGGGERVKNEIDPIYHLPIISLYNEENTFNVEDFEDIDVFIYDIQDITARFYTYIATLKGVMQFFSKNSIDKKIVILDRPAFLGNGIEGTLPERLNFLSPEYIPIRYGMTPGEFAVFSKRENNLDIDLEIIKMKNYSKKKLFYQLNLPFIPPSSAIKNFDIAFFYTGSCLLEGTNISEGRGTPLPFLIFGHPEYKNINFQFEGIQYSHIQFKPAYNKYKGENCSGIKIEKIDYHKAHPFRDMVLFLMEWYKIMGFEFVLPHFDRLSGGDFLRKMIINYDKEGFINRLKKDEENFKNICINLY